MVEIDEEEEDEVDRSLDEEDSELDEDEVDSEVEDEEVSDFGDEEEESKLDGEDEEVVIGSMVTEGCWVDDDVSVEVQGFDHHVFHL